MKIEQQSDKNIIVVAVQGKLIGETEIHSIHSAKLRARKTGFRLYS